MSVKIMDAIHISSCENDQNQVLKTNGCKPIKFRNSSHSVRVFEVLQYLRKNEVLCDIRLQTDDGTIVSGHKVVLISASSYFRIMLTRFDEGKRDLVKIRELDSTVLQLLVDYVYTGEIIVTIQNVQVLLPAADLLQFDYVKGVCAEFLQTQLEPSNCIGIKRFADFYYCSKLVASCVKFIKKQFLKVVEHDEFLSLSSKQVIEIISSNDLAVRFEEKIFESVLNWVRHKLDARYDKLPKLIVHVRWPLASKEYISKIVVKEPLIKNSPECRDYVIESLNYHKLKAQQLITIPQAICTKPRRSGETILVVFSSENEETSYAHFYDPATNLWKIAPKMSKMRVQGPIALVKEHFMFSLGSEYQPTRTCKILDSSLQSPCWISTVDMLVKRNAFGIGVIDECIYAVGGYNDDEHFLINNVSLIINNAEVFNISTQKWQMISSMSKKRIGLGIGVLNNLVYAVGGLDELSEFLKSVECYDPSLDVWTPIADMSVGRCGLGIGVLDGVLYAIGGCNNSEYSKSVEAYRPITGAWSSIADMHKCRYNPRVFVLEGLLYVVGGEDNNYIHLNSMEIYNPNTNTWTIEPCPNVKNNCGGVVVDKFFTL